MSGERNESLVFEVLMDAGVVPQGAGPGRPRLRPEAVCADKGYSNLRIRAWCKAHRVACVVPTLSNQHPLPHFDSRAYRKRNCVERLIGRLKQCRRVATRYDKRAVHYLAFVVLASIRLWL
jgi:transposase